MAKKKTLYKIPTEEEISGAKPPKNTESTVAPEPPVVEPKPMVVLDTAEDKKKSDALVAAENLVKKREKEKRIQEVAAKEQRTKKLVSDFGNLSGDPVDDFDSISSGEARIFKSNEDARKLYNEEMGVKEEETGPPPVSETVYDHETVRLIFRETDFTQLEGISVGGRNVVHAKNARRLTREKRRENIEKRKAMKVMVAGEEQELSEASKYMLDMLIKNPTKD